jgi:hypothetical protein
VTHRSHDHDHVGRNVRGAKCPWGELSVERNVRGAKCLWGEMSVGRNVCGARCRGASCPGARCPGASCPGASCLGASGPGTAEIYALQISDLPLISVYAFYRIREISQYQLELINLLFLGAIYVGTYIIGCPCGCCCLCIVNILITFTIIHLFHRLEINTIIVNQLYGYFKQLVTDFLRGNDTIDES